MQAEVRKAEQSYRRTQQRKLPGNSHISCTAVGAAVAQFLQTSGQCEVAIVHCNLLRQLAVEILCPHIAAAITHQPARQHQRVSLCNLPSLTPTITLTRYTLTIIVLIITIIAKRTFALDLDATCQHMQGVLSVKVSGRHCSLATLIIHNKQCFFRTLAGAHIAHSHQGTKPALHVVLVTSL